MNWFNCNNDTVSYFNDLWNENYLNIQITNDGLAYICLGFYEESIKMQFESRQQAMKELEEAFS